MFFRQLLSPTLQPRSFVMAMFVMLISSAAIVAQDGRTELPVRGGLTVWLDASTIAERPSDGASEGTNVIEWKDSAARRIFEQRDSKLQPKLMSVAGTSFVRFDGVDDHLRVIRNGSVCRHPRSLSSPLRMRIRASFEVYSPPTRRIEETTNWGSPLILGRALDFVSKR